MNNTGKRILCCVLSCLILVSLLPLPALAQEQGGGAIPSGDGTAEGFVSGADGAGSDGGQEDGSLPEDVQEEAPPRKFSHLK